MELTQRLVAFRQVVGADWLGDDEPKLGHSSVGEISAQVEDGELVGDGAETCEEEVGVQGAIGKLGQREACPPWGMKEVYSHVLQEHHWRRGIELTSPNRLASLQIVSKNPPILGAREK